jgi:hypothetical protein
MELRRRRDAGRRKNCNADGGQDHFQVRIHDRPPLFLVEMTVFLALRRRPAVSHPLSGA